MTIKFVKGIDIIAKKCYNKNTNPAQAGWAGRKTLVHRTAGNFPATFFTLKNTDVKQKIKYIYRRIG